ncbi:putative transcription factor interactor and regulator CCHC(Zn) family [Helianthus debilis subsp. tardiflorus]
MELMDIKWCLASVLRRAEKFKTITGRNDFLDAHVSTLGFDKSKVTCFRYREKGHFKWECKNREVSGAQNPFGKNDYYRKAIYQQVGQSQDSQTAHGRKLEDSKRACLVDFNWSNYISPDSKACIVDQDDERLPEGFSWDMFVDEKGEFKAFIAKIVREPDMFATWMKSIGVHVTSEDEKSVTSDENSESVDELSERSGEISEGSDESVQNVASSEKRSYRLERLKAKRAEKEHMEMKIESVVEENDKTELVSEEKIPEVEKMKEDEKVIEVVKTIEVEKMVEVVKPCEKCLETCKECAAKDEIIVEYEKKKEQLLFNLNYVKESYDVLNKTVTGLQKKNSEREQALTMMNAVMMSKQKAINFYIEESAKWKQELETEKIENERIRRLLQGYSSSDYLIDRIYPTVAGMEAFQDEKPKKKKDCGKKLTVSYKKCPPPIWEGYSPRKPNEEQLEKAINIKLKTNTTDVLPDNIDDTFTSSDTDHETELIKKVVDQVLDTDEESESKSESRKSKLPVNRENSSVKRSYRKNFCYQKQI